jgi:phospholipid transport system substrate-binding protein
MRCRHETDDHFRHYRPLGSGPSTAPTKAADGVVEMAIQRRNLLKQFLVGAIIASPLSAQAYAAQITAPSDPKAAVESLNAALVATMKAGTQTSVAQRFAIVAPAVDRAFDLPTVLRNSIGLRWASLPDEEKFHLLASFRRYTIASYVASFNNWSGQTFRVDAIPRVLSPTQVVVRNVLVAASGSPVELGYVMQRTDEGWKIVDVLADGAISRVAVQRSDFRGLLASGGVAALVTSLERKAADLSGGAVA